MHTFRKTFLKELENVKLNKTPHDLFIDFITTYSLGYHVHLAGDTKHIEIMKNALKEYKAEDLQVFDKLVHLLATKLKEKPQDYLGNIYMHLNLNQSKQGQVFTPSHISHLGAEMTLAMQSKREPDTVLDICCGSGSLLIGHIAALHDKGEDYTQEYYIGYDIDKNMVYMCYLQMCLLEVAATIYHGNAMTQEIYDTYHTERHVWHKIWDTFNEKKDTN